jgi:O-antigen/teichoic acid export membrane protein
MPASRRIALRALKYGRRYMGSAARDAAGTLGLQVVALALGFVSNILVARFAGVDGYGYYAVALGWSALLTIPSVMGLDRVLIRELGTYVAEGRHALARGLLRRANQLALAAGLSFSLVTLAIALPTSQPGARYAVLLGLVCLVPLSALSRVVLASLQGLRRSTLALFTQSIVRAVCFLTLLVTCGILLSSSSLSAEAAVALQAAGTALAIAVGTIALWRTLPALTRSTAPEYASRQWAQGLKTLGLLGIVGVLSSQLALISMGAIGTPAATGQFAAATRTAVLVGLGYFATNAVIGPRIAARHRNADTWELQQLLLRGAAASFIVALPIAISLIIFGSQILAAFGSDFSSGQASLAILVIGQLANGITGSAGMALIMTGHEVDALVSAAVGTLLNLILCVLLIPRLQDQGAATAAVAGVILTNTVLVIQVYRRLHIRLWAFQALRAS